MPYEARWGCVGERERREAMSVRKGIVTAREVSERARARTIRGGWERTVWQASCEATGRREEEHISD